MTKSNSLLQARSLSSCIPYTVNKKGCRSYYWCCTSGRTVELRAPQQNFLSFLVFSLVPFSKIATSSQAVPIIDNQSVTILFTMMMSSATRNEVNIIHVVPPTIAPKSIANNALETLAIGETSGQTRIPKNIVSPDVCYWDSMSERQGWFSWMRSRGSDNTMEMGGMWRSWEGTNTPASFLPGYWASCTNQLISSPANSSSVGESGILYRQHWLANYRRITI